GALLRVPYEADDRTAGARELDGGAAPATDRDELGITRIEPPDPRAKLEVALDEPAEPRRIPLTERLHALGSEPSELADGGAPVRVAALPARAYRGVDGARVAARLRVPGDEDLRKAGGIEHDVAPRLGEVHREEALVGLDDTVHRPRRDAEFLGLGAPRE